MKRRSFLQLLGVGAAVAATKPSIVLAATPQKPEILLTEFALRAGQFRARNAQGIWVSGLVLEAPAGRLCRARIRLAADSEAYAMIRYLLGGTPPGAVVIEQVRTVNPDADLPHFMAPLDAGMFDLDSPVPVEWPALTKTQYLEIDYRAFGDTDENLFLGLWWEAGAITRSPGCFPGGH